MTPFNKKPAPVAAQHSKEFVSHNGNPEVNGNYAEYYEHLKATGQLEDAKDEGVVFYKDGKLFDHRV